MDSVHVCGCFLSAGPAQEPLPTACSCLSSWDKPTDSRGGGTPSRNSQPQRPPHRVTGIRPAKSPDPVTRTTGDGADLPPGSPLSPRGPLSAPGVPSQPPGVPLRPLPQSQCPCLCSHVSSILTHPFPWLCPEPPDASGQGAPHSSSPDPTGDPTEGPAGGHSELRGHSHCPSQPPQGPRTGSPPRTGRAGPWCPEPLTSRPP